ncbi:hypothetical protein E0U60_06340 [Salmonella enterica subsp. enterica serovar Tees]|nr:hypothetical protein [Salmonella enterica subsp. enterica serovar Tees]EDV2954385.1 hypothetical protein [Salmonella enterica subsp. enterica]EKE2795752.1 hypothetical protein [Salmonella enterica]EBF8336030.1 hypothetical protein [Salmonella enterica subsp. enterica serovar Tees]EBY6556505.1 hypothetical protein [Salmonella enterica subsp. enterica serovar Tees]
MTSLIVTSLRKIGPCLSSILVEEMLKTQGVNRDTARKQISRAASAGQIHCVDKLFPKRERFIYLKQQYGTGRFWSSLNTALLDTGSAYGLALSCLRARGGILPVRHFPAACGSPVAMKNRLSWKSVLDGLLQYKMVRVVTLPSLGECVALTEKNDNGYQRALHPLKARLLTESVLMKSLSQWVRHNGIISYDTLRTREGIDSDQAPCVANFDFDVTAASYLNPLLQFSRSGEIRPGFFVCDMLLGCKLSLVHLQPFITKCRSINSLRNSPRCLFMFIADEYSEEAFLEMKRTGIIPATPENLFGKEFADALFQLRDLVGSITLSLKNNIAAIDDIMSKLTNIAGVTNQLQGDLFEYIVAETVRIDSKDVEVGKICKSLKGETAECDVLSVNGYAKITFIECKGYKPYSTVRHEDVKKWIGKQVPVFFSYAKKEYPNAEINVELWTTGKLCDDSRESLRKFQENNLTNQRYNITVMEPHDVRKRIKATWNDALIRVFEKHFLSYPEKIVRRKHVPEPVRLAGHDEATEFDF